MLIRLGVAPDQNASIVPLQYLFIIIMEYRGKTIQVIRGFMTKKMMETEFLHGLLGFLK